MTDIAIINIIRFIKQLIKPYKFYLIGLLILEFIWATQTLLRPYFVKITIDYFATSQSYDIEHNHVVIILSLLTFIAFVQTFIFRISDYLYMKMMPFLLKDINIKCFDLVFKQSIGYFKNNLSGSIANRIYNTTDSVDDIMHLLIDKFIPNIFILIISIISFWIIVSGSFAFLFFCLFTLLIILDIYFVQKPYKFSKLHMKVYIEFIGKLSDNVANVLAIILFGRKKYEHSRIRKYALQEAYCRQKMQKNILYTEIINSLYLMIIYIICTTYLMYLYNTNIISIGDMTFVFLLIMSISDSVQKIIRDSLQFLILFGKCSQTLNIIATQNIIKDKKNAFNIKVTEGMIKFTDVCFEYSNATSLFKNLSLRINSREKVVLIGGSGSGKTTFVELIPRLFELKSGSISIDNQNISDVTQESLNNSITFVPQSPLLFNRTIFENISYGKSASSLKEVIIAAKKALAHEFIIKLPNGYDTIVGDLGSLVSGGQRQRLAIARAFLKNSQIIILDEFTSSLDLEIKKKLLKNLYEFFHTKTVIMISHQLLDLYSADRIIMFSEGKVVADGTHDELLKHNSFYQKLAVASESF